MSINTVLLLGNVPRCVCPLPTCMKSMREQKSKHSSTTSHQTSISLSFTGKKFLQPMRSECKYIGDYPPLPPVPIICQGISGRHPAFAIVWSSISCHFCLSICLNGKSFLSYFTRNGFFKIGSFPVISKRHCFLLLTIVGLSLVHRA